MPTLLGLSPSTLLNMRPQRISILLHHNPIISPRLPHYVHLSFRCQSTASSPSLIQIRDIPAPHTGHIRILSLNSPHNRNAISRQLLYELSHEINTIKTQVEDEATKGEVVGHGTRVLVLASEVDACFCAGADLKERSGMSHAESISPFLR